MHPIRRETQVPCQEQVHESDLQFVHWLHEEPKPAKNITFLSQALPQKRQENHDE